MGAAWTRSAPVDPDDDTGNTIDWDEEFKKIDVNDDQSVTPKEFKDYVKEQFPDTERNKESKYSDDELDNLIQKIFKKADGNRDGKLDVTEFRCLMEKFTWHFGDEKWRNTPYVTIGLILINCFAFILTMFVADWKFVSRDENSMWGPSVEDLLESGGLTSVSVICNAEWWRIFVSFFLHSGVLHLGGNMIALWILGAWLEKSFGPYDMLTVYLSSGIAGQISSALFLPNSVSVGASGAIFGLLGARWADHLQNYLFFHHLDEKPSFALLLVSTIALVGYSLLPDLNAFAHVFGLFTGSLIGDIVLIRPRVVTPLWAFWDKTAGEMFMGDNFNVEVIRTWGQQVRVLLAACAIAIEFLAFIYLFNAEDVYEECEYCKYLQCFETPWWGCDDFSLASCSFEKLNSADKCTSIDPDFEGDCVLITCLDGSIHPLDTELTPTAADCYEVCGPDYIHCRD